MGPLSWPVPHSQPFTKLPIFNKNVLHALSIVPCLPQLLKRTSFLRSGNDIFVFFLLCMGYIWHSRSIIWWWIQGMGKWHINYRKVHCNHKQWFQIMVPVQLVNSKCRGRIYHPQILYIYTVWINLKVIYTDSSQEMIER